MKTVLGILSLSLLLGAGPCSNSEPSQADPRISRATPQNAESIGAALRDAGLHVRAADTISQPFFSVPGHVLVVEADDLQVYEYRSSDAAAADAAKISPSGSPIGTSMPNWMRPPHIYRKDNVILIYLGENPRVRSTLESQEGSQIAGAR